MFRDMMHVYTTNNGFECNGLTSNFNVADNFKNATQYTGEKYLDLYTDTHPYCSTDLLSSYGAVFGILRSHFDGKFDVSSGLVTR